MLFSRFLSTLESHSDESCTLKILRIRMLVEPCHSNTLEKNYDHTIFYARTTFNKSLHERDVNMLVIRDFLCILHATFYSSWHEACTSSGIYTSYNDPTTNSTSKVGDVT